MVDVGKENILIIIVIYKKDVNELKYLSGFLSGKIDVLIYDNSLVGQHCSQEYYYIHDKNNSGVSKAYNEGIKLAKKLNKKNILLLDQDTKFTLDILKKYEKLLEKYGEDYIYTSIIGKGDKIYSPFLEKKFRGRPQNREKFKYVEIYNLKGKSIINSGMLVPLKIIDKIGIFNEKIKLDFSDMYFIDKYKKYRNEIILIDNFIEHSLSGDEGKDKNKELHRFKFYCNGAKELYIEDKRIEITVFFRMAKLILKYRDLKPIVIYFKYFWGNDKI